MRRQAFPAFEPEGVIVPDPALRGGLHGGGQLPYQRQPPFQAQLLPGQELQRQGPSPSQAQIGLRVQLVGDDGRLVLPFLPDGRGRGRQGVGRGAAQTEPVLRQIAELPMEAGILPADPAQGFVAEVPLDMAEPVRVQQDADAVFILPQYGLRAGKDPFADPLGRGSGQGPVKRPCIVVDYDLPAGAAAAVGAAARGAGKGPEAGGGQVLHGRAMCLSICTQRSMSSTGMYS